MSILPADTQSSILASKFAPPLLHSGLVERPELVARLERGLINHRLTLLAAPAGSGKTSLVGQWLKTRRDWPVAWLSLEAGENDLQRFWLCLMHTCRGF